MRCGAQALSPRKRRSSRPDARALFETTADCDAAVSFCFVQRSRSKSELGAPSLLQAPPDAHARLNGYVGSVSFTRTGNSVAITSPRGSVVQVFDPQTGAPTEVHDLDDVCGIAASETGFFVTSGTGVASALGDTASSRSAWAWDNHLVPV